MSDNPNPVPLSPQEQEIADLIVEIQKVLAQLDRMIARAEAIDTDTIEQKIEQLEKNNEQS